MTDNAGNGTTEVLCEMAGGETVYRNGTCIVAVLPPGRTVLSTSWLNGGCRKGLRMVFNHQLSEGSCRSDDLEGGGIEAYLRLTASRLGFDPDLATGMLTKADMGNAAVATHTFRDLAVTAVITGGIEVNGGRAGDPASFYEENGEFGDLGGTINTMLFISACLPPETMTRVVMTAAEAKASALQELMAPSQYSEGIATGSGTDMITVVSDGTSPLFVTNAGKHAKLGELIGRCVREATRDALGRQTGLGSESQQNMLVRLERFGIGEEDFWEAASGLPGEHNREAFLSSLRKRATDPVLVAATASVLHIADEVAWGLLPPEAGMHVARSMMTGMTAATGTDGPAGFDKAGNDGHTIPEEWVRFVSICIEKHQSFIH
ncbi:adenosylcobinamide amidohydrolase [Methanogenium organophilum]|uniref:Adenosylcobinamide amidohydrolase n=1 Tax=Methanogenium organophilum TaxID=2199 RepID=A0A9X9T883_METOG|nr:adenosylcobinamide amidohydrolase [Methanogenium organophilum]WAI02153.1 adenosylcobinamide amidohydrolase [Methanogenium organophilum]